MRWRIPKIWRWKTVGEIAEVVGGGTPTASDPSNFDEKGIPWITPADLSGYAGTYIEWGSRSLSQKGYDSSGAKLMPSRAVLFSSRAPIGYCVIARNPVSTNQGFKSLVLKEGVLPEYVRYYLLGSKQYVEDLASGTTFKEISGRRMAEVMVPIAPLPEQHRIVTAIETHFSRLDAAVTSLTRAQANVKRARASVLKAAVEGRLVPTEAAQAHAEGRDYEPAAALLARILTERKAAWTQGGARGRYKEPVKPETDGLPELPEGWCWATVDDLARSGGKGLCDGPFGSNLKSAHYVESGPRVVRLQNIGDGVFRDEHAHITDDHFKSLRKHEIKGGDLVIASLGEILPRACIIPDWLGSAIVKADCIRFSTTQHVSVPFLNVVLNSPPIRKRTTDRIHGIGRPRLGLGGIREITIPLPPLAEQHRIVAEVDRRLSVLDALDAMLDANLARCARLRQAVLKRAFEGRLVPAEPQPALSGASGAL